MLFYKLLIVLLTITLHSHALHTYPEATNVSNSSYFPFKGDIFTGFIPVNNTSGSNIFYSLYGFNNGSINQSAPLIIWLAGGPGCDSVFGPFARFGPISVGSKDKNYTLSPRHLTWNTLGHLLTLDQPIGTGFSNAFGGEAVKTTDQAAEHFQAFMVRFYQLFPNLIGNDLYMVGVSYAGHFIPAFAHKLLSNTSNSYIKLKGVVIGAPWTDGLRQVSTEGDFYYVGSIANQKIRDYMHRMEITVVQAILSGDYEYASYLADYKGEYIRQLTLASDDSYRKSANDPENPDDGTNEWLNLTSTQSMLGIPYKVDYGDFSKEVYSNMMADMTISYIDRLPLLLQNIKVLVFACQDDTAVQYSGVVEFLKFVEWDGMRDIEVQPKKVWNVNGKVAGFYKSNLNYTYLTVIDSGHMAPGDQPEPMYDLLNRFINTIPFN